MAAADTLPELHGIIPYLVTPVDASTGAVNTAELARLCEHLIAAGVHGLSPLGSTGEFPYLTAPQRLATVETVVAAAAGRVPVVAGVGAFATHDAVEQARAYVAAGVDALVVILQQYFPLTEAQVEDYFRAIADAVDVPLCLYTNPGFLGNELSLAAIERLSAVPTIRYVKDASTNTGRILSIVNACGDRIRVFSASAHVPMLVFQLGGVGWMGGPACVIPRQCAQLYELTRQRRWDEAMILQADLWRINQLFARYSPAACVKTALQAQGFDVGDAVAPQTRLGDDAVAAITAALESLGALAAPAVSVAGAS